MIPEKVQKKADEVLARYLAREIHPKRLRGSGRGLALAVGYSWRLLSWDNGETWDLLSHEEYNTKTRGHQPRTNKRRRKT